GLATLRLLQSRQNAFERGLDAFARRLLRKLQLTPRVRIEKRERSRVLAKPGGHARAVAADPQGFNHSRGFIAGLERIFSAGNVEDGPRYLGLDDGEARRGVMIEGDLRARWVQYLAQI